MKSPGIGVILGVTAAQSSPQVLYCHLMTILLGRSYCHFYCADRDAGSMTLNHAQGALKPGQANLELRQARAILQRGHVDERLPLFPVPHPRPPPSLDECRLSAALLRSLGLEALLVLEDP